MSDPLQVGTTPRFTALFAVNGTATNPTVVKFKYRTPAGVETELVYDTDVEVVRASTGNYYVELNLNVAGTWLVRWVSTGAVAAANEYPVRVEPSRFADPT